MSNIFSKIIVVTTISVLLAVVLLSLAYAQTSTIATAKKVVDTIGFLQQADQMLGKLKEGAEIGVGDSSFINPSLVNDLKKAVKYASSPYVEIDIPQHVISADDVFSKDPAVRMNAVILLSEISTGQEKNLVALDEESIKLGRMIDTTDSLIPFYERYLDTLEKLANIPEASIANNVGYAWLSVRENILPHLKNINSDAKNKKIKVDETAKKRKSDHKNFESNLEVLRSIHESVLIYEEAKAATPEAYKAIAAANEAAGGAKTTANNVVYIMEAMGTDIDKYRAIVNRMIGQADEHAKDRIEAIIKSQDEASRRLGTDTKKPQTSVDGPTTTIDPKNKPTSIQRKERTPKERQKPNNGGQTPNPHPSVIMNRRG